MTDCGCGAGQVFGPIGMTMSGGGSRAAAFHLGTLEYLHRLGLLKDVEMLSSASGGSFVAAKYACMLSEELREKQVSCRQGGKAYEKFFDDFFNLFFKQSYMDLRDTRAIQKVVDSVGKERAADSCNYRIPSGRYALINIAADLYAETFLMSAKGTPYLLGELLDQPETGYPLKHVILNATDYHHGIAFRFSSNPETCIGNFLLYQGDDENGDSENLADSARQECRDIRVADIVAASSCLPPLFEPMGFPDDFAWPDGSIPPTLQKLCSDRTSGDTANRRPIPLMDGGLYDNQAIESVMLADRNLTLKELNRLLLADKWGEDRETDLRERSRAASQLNMFIVSDAQRKSVDDDPYDYNHMRNRRLFGIHNKGLPFSHVITAGLAFVLVLAAVVAVDFAESLRALGPARIGRLLARLALLCGTVTFLTFTLKRAWALRPVLGKADEAKTGSDLLKMLAYGLPAVLLSAATYLLWGDPADPGPAGLLLFALRLLSVAGVTTIFIWVAIFIWKIWNASDEIPQVGRKAWLGFFRIRFQWLVDAVCFRLSSSMATIFEVLLKRTRDLGYFVFYGDRFYHKKRVSNLLYRLIPGERTDVLEGAQEEWEKVRDLFTPSAKLQEYVQHANNVGTRFWFSEKKPWEQPCLVCAGQATICFSMAQYIVRNHGGDSGSYSEDVRNLWERLAADWRSLNENPYSLLEARIEELKQDQAGGKQIITCIKPEI